MSIFSFKDISGIKGKISGRIQNNYFPKNKPSKR
jgi:hypothetical protein